jgi:hypothetical protein
MVWGLAEESSIHFERQTRIANIITNKVVP